MKLDAVLPKTVLLLLLLGTQLWGGGATLRAGRNAGGLRDSKWGGGGGVPAPDSGVHEKLFPQKCH